MTPEAGGAVGPHAAAPSIEAESTSYAPDGAQVLVLHYGTSDQQTVEVVSPMIPSGAKGMAVLIHGGYWRAKFDRTLMAELAADLVLRGWAVSNVEYRRCGNGGGWPATANDVRAALGIIRSYTNEHFKQGPIIGIGHSVGGQLALLGAEFMDAVVALAPVSDIARTEREGLGESAALEFMGGSSCQAPGEYAQASPIRQLPLGRPILLVHGDVDVRVPVQHSLDFYAAAIEHGDDVTLRITAGLSHLDAINPRASHWLEVLQWMEGISFLNRDCLEARERKSLDNQESSSK